MIHNDYFPCDFYKGKPSHEKFSEFSSFFDEKANKYFFALLDAKGKVLFKSEGYATEKSRENGIASVIKNRELKERYGVLAEEAVFYVILRAGNRQEIARSCEFTSQAEAEAWLSKWLSAGEVPTPAKKKVEKVAAAKTASVKSLAKSSTKEVAAKKEVVAKEEVPTISAATELTPPSNEEVSSEKTVPTQEVTVGGASFYPTSLDVYFNRPVLYDENGPTGYALFEDNGFHYFVVYNYDGSLYSRSRAYVSGEERDADFAALRDNITNPARYSIIEDAGNFWAIIIGENNQELSRSVAYNSFTEAFLTTPNGRPQEYVGTIY